MVEIARYLRTLDIKDLINLNIGEPDFDTPAHVREAAINAINEGRTHYTPSEGIPKLREAIAQKLHRENNLDYSADQVTVVSGSQEGISVIAQTLFGPGDEVINGSPHYPSYVFNASMRGARTVFVPLRKEEGYQMTAEDIERAVTPRTKAIVIISPNNPTGGMQSLEELRSIAEVAQKHDLLVISDEIYERIVYEGHEHHSIGSIPGMMERTITANGFSKSYSMTGWRIGYFAAPKEINDKLQAVHRATAICPPSVAQYAALAALNGPQECVEEMSREFGIRRKLVLKMLREIPNVTVGEPAGAFYAFPDFSFYCGEDDEEFARELIREAHVVLLPGSSFGELGRGHLRLSFASSLAKLEEGLKRIQAYLEKRRSKLGLFP